MTQSRRGTFLILLASLLGLGVAAYDYVAVSTGIDHSGGVELVIASLSLMLAAALAVALLRPGLVTGILLFLILLDIAGSFAAAWFLESGLLMAAMALAALGLLLRRTPPRTLA